MKYLYLDGSCGISGDMTVAALLDLGASREKLDAAINSMHLDGMHCHFGRGNSYSIAGATFDVHVHTHEGEVSADHVHPHEEGYVEHHHSHEGEHLHHSHEDCAGHHHHDHEHEHSHEHHGHEHHHGEGYHHHEHRHLNDCYHILEHVASHGTLSDNALAIAKKIFLIIAQAEAKAHGVAVEEVHFHEVGAIDSIVDIMAVAILVDNLQQTQGIDGVIVTGLNEGSGFVQTQHGMLPIPVPAVSSIAEAAGIALHITDTKGEMVTPTGIGVVAALRTSETLPQSYKILKSGIGLGKRDFGRANFLRAQIIEDTANVKDTTCVGNSSTGNSAADTHVYILECNIDDNTAEELGYAMEKILEAGARDVHFMPCQMKKNRPGTLLRAIADSSSLAVVEHAILKYTNTVGLRRIPVERTCMSRSFLNVETKFGTVKVKKSVFKSPLGDIEKCKPEFDDVKSLAEKAGVTFREVFNEALSCLNR